MLCYMTACPWLVIRTPLVTTRSTSKMHIKTVEVDTYDCHKWIAVGDIDLVLDFPLKDYKQYYFSDLYIVGNSGNDDGIFYVYKPRKNGVE